MDPLISAKLDDGNHKKVFSNFAFGIFQKKCNQKSQGQNKEICMYVKKTKDNML